MTDTDQPVKPEERTVVKVKTYTFTDTMYSDGKVTLGRTNDGFNLLELLGICNLIQIELTALLNGNKAYAPDVIERKFIKEDK